MKKICKDCPERQDCIDGIVTECRIGNREARTCMDYKHAGKSLRWLANQFQKIEEPKDDSDKIVNCIYLYCENGARAIADLISRAEEAEQRCKELEARCKRLVEARERANEAAAKWEGMYRMALERAERAARERDAAVWWLREIGICGACSNTLCRERDGEQDCNFIFSGAIGSKEE